MITKYRTVKIDGLDIFYREAGSPDAPVILFLVKKIRYFASLPIASTHLKKRELFSQNQ